MTRNARRRLCTVLRAGGCWQCTSGATPSLKGQVLHQRPTAPLHTMTVPLQQLRQVRKEDIPAVSAIPIVERLSLHRVSLACLFLARMCPEVSSSVL